MDVNGDFVQKQTEAAQLTSFANADAEKAIIGCALRNFNDCSSYIAELRNDDFYYGKHRNIFKAIRMAVAEQMEVNLITVDQMLEKLLPGATSEYPPLLVECTRGIFSTIAISSYFRIVRELSVRRRAILMVNNAIAQLNDPSQNINAIMDALRTDACDLTVGNHSWMPMSDVMLNTYANLEQRVNGEITSITTGIKNIDSLIGGFFGGEMTVIGARPAVGKSVFGMNVAMAAAADGFKVGVVSREMSDIQYGQRILSYETRLDGMKIRKADIKEDEWQLITEGMTMASALPIEFLFTVRTVEDLRAEVQRKVNRGELDMLIVDYLQLMSSSQRFKEDRLRVGYISQSLKSIALDFNIPVIALAQVKRYAGGARATMPTLEDLKDSGSIEQDADGVIFLHNPYDEDDNYIDPRDRDMFQTYKANGYTYLCIGVAKQRQGTTGVACVLFDKRTMRYLAIDRSWVEEAQNA